MSRTVTMDANGRFLVSDDPLGVLSVGLLIATTSQNAPRVHSELAPGGAGLHVETFGSIDPLESRSDLPSPYDEDLTLDPERQELWRIYREPDRVWPTGAQIVISGEELRELVEVALALRQERKS
jgi:hypothetical protein